MRPSRPTALAVASLLALTACGGSTTTAEEEGESPLAAPPSTAPTAPPLDEVTPAPVEGPRVSGTGYVATLPPEALVTPSPSWDYSVVVGSTTTAEEEGESPLAAPPSTAPTAPPLDEVTPAPVEGPRVSGTGYVATLPPEALVTPSPSWDYSVVVGSTTTELRTLDGALPEDVFETVDGVVDGLSGSPYEGVTRVAVEWDGVSDTYLVSALDTSTDAYVVELVAAFGDDLVEVRASAEGPEGDEPFSYPDLSVLRSVAAG